MAWWNRQMGDRDQSAPPPMGVRVFTPHSDDPEEQLELPLLEAHEHIEERFRAAEGQE